MGDRVVRGTAATLSVTFASDETPTDADGLVTVTVTSDDGSVIVTDAATVHAGTGRYTYTLPPQSAVKRLELAWTGTFGGVAQTLGTEAEVVTKRLFSYADARAFDTVIADATKYPTATLERVRTEVEDEFEQICGRAFIGRWGLTDVIGGGSAVLRRLAHYDMQLLLGGTVAGVALTNGEISAVTVIDDDLLRRGAGVWVELARVRLFYEYGLLDVDPIVKRAALRRTRYVLTADHAGKMDRATRMDTPEGTSYDLATPGRDGWETGIPDVDSVLERFMTPRRRRERAAALAARAAS